MHELVGKIQLAMSMGAYDQVVKYYLQSEATVRLFPEEQSFALEHVQAEEYARRLRTILEGRITDVKRPLEDVSNDAQLLLRLHVPEQEVMVSIHKQFSFLLFSISSHSSPL